MLRNIENTLRKSNICIIGVPEDKEEHMRELIFMQVMG